MLVDGVTVTVLPEIFPGIQLYVVAPPAVNEAVLPAQIVPGVEDEAGSLLEKKDRREPPPRFAKLQKTTKERLARSSNLGT